jgi:hypothetical protein
MYQAQMEKKQMSYARSRDHPCEVRRLSSEQIMLSENNTLKKLSIILLTEKSVERHPNPIYENLVAKKPLSSKPGKLFVLLQILNLIVHQTCRTIHQMLKSGKSSIYPISIKIQNAKC